MKRSNRILILVGILLAAVAFIGVVGIANNGGAGSAGATPKPTLEATTPVVIAAKDIAIGSTITADMVTVQQVTVSQAAAYGTDTFFSVSQVTDKVAATAIQKGNPLHNGIDILHIVPGAVAQGQTISSTIDPGFVAVSMEVDQTNGVGTLIVPGDHVDIILSVYVDQIALTATDTEKTVVTLPGAQQPTSKMFSQNNKVLATLLPAEAPVAQLPNAAASPTPASSASQGSITNNGQHMIVIVAVKPDVAEVIRWAQRAEKQDPQTYIDLGLALRSPKDDAAPDVATIGVTFSELVNRYGVLPPDPRGIIPASLAAGIKW